MMKMVRRKKQAMRSRCRISMKSSCGACACRYVNRTIGWPNYRVLLNILCLISCKVGGVKELLTDTGSSTGRHLSKRQYSMKSPLKNCLENSSGLPPSTHCLHVFRKLSSHGRAAGYPAKTVSVAWLSQLHLANHGLSGLLHQCYSLARC